MDIEDYHKISNSHLELDTNYFSDIGLGQYALRNLLWDTMAVEINDDNDVREQNGIYVASNRDVMAWRKGKVIAVGGDVRHCEVGDYVLLPNSKGIDAGSVWVDADGVIAQHHNVIVVAESRILATLTPPPANPKR